MMKMALWHVDRSNCHSNNTFYILQKCKRKNVNESETLENKTSEINEMTDSESADDIVQTDTSDNEVEGEINIKDV